MIELNNCDLYHYNLRVMYNPERDRLTTGSMDIIMDTQDILLKDSQGKIGSLITKYNGNPFITDTLLFFIEDGTNICTTASLNEVYTVLTPIPYSNFKI